MGCLWSLFRKLTVAICAILKVALATAIIIIVAVHLQDVKVNVTVSDRPVEVKAECLMTGDVQGGTVCEYAYAVCGLSLLTSLVLSLFLCITCDACGLGSWFEFIIGGLLTAWWIVAGIVFTSKVRDTNQQVPAVPNEDWRNAVVVMAWVCAVLAGITTLVYMVDAIKCLKDCCSCCCCSCDDDDDRRKANAV